MNVTSFYSSNKYLLLPTPNNPKVALAVDTSAQAKNAFKLYNPFSEKAKYLKKLSQFLFLKTNKLASAIAAKKNREKGEFITYLEKKLTTPLVSSVYFATAKDKVVLQLQSKDKIIGYVKFPLNAIGVQHLNNEIKAIAILSEKKIIAPAILIDAFNDVPYVFLEELKGEIKEVSENELQIVLQKFKKQDRFLLKEHPFLIQLNKKLKSNSLQNEIGILDAICNTSLVNYFEVYEHGDFTPWNLIRTNQQLIPFDFEYFEENGLEYMDLIKYHFQTGYLLKGLSGTELIDFIRQKITISEINSLVTIFLIKEIVRKTEENESCVFEREILLHLTQENV